MLDLKNYDALILDFGGVIINIDYNKTVAAFASLGLPLFNEVFSKKEQNELADQFEKGQISDIEFLENLQNRFAVKPTLTQLKAAWNSMLLDIPASRVALIKQLNTKLPIYLLSNTNCTHIDAINAYLLKDHQVNSVHPWFDEVFFSFEMGMRKPDAEIFETVIQKHQLNPSKTLFVDDSPQHLIGASKVGLQTHHLLDDQDLLNLFANS